MDSSIRELRPDDADDLVACFRRCYGETYPNEDFYQPEVLRAAVASGRLRSVVVITAEGALVGHTGMTKRFDDARVIEAGNTVVDPEMRGHGLLAKLGAGLADLCRRLGYGGYVHYPTTAHEMMQRVSIRRDGVETGIMLAYIPAETDYREIDRDAGRLAATIVYQPLAPLPERTVVFPRRYETVLADLFRATELPRLPGRAETPTGESVVSIDHRLSRRLVHISVASIGADLADAVEVAGRSNPPAPVVHVDLPLDDSGIDAGVDALVGRGFFFCGLLPEFGPGDVLRLQRLVDQPDSAHRPDLANDGARQLLGFINADIGREADAG